MKTIELDFKGLLCPLPVLKTKKAMRALKGGDVVEVWTTDPGAMADFQCLCDEDGHELLAQQQHDGACLHRLKKG